MKKILSQKGVNLIELIFVLAIISILATLSFNSFSDYLIKAHRLEAINALQKIALALEQYELQHHTYQNANFRKLHLQDHTRWHTLILSGLSRTSYVLHAAPIATDVECGELRLNAEDKKEISGTGKVADCWQY